MNPFDAMDLNNDGNVDFSDFMLFNTFINPQPDNRPDDLFNRQDDGKSGENERDNPFWGGW